MTTTETAHEPPTISAAELNDAAATFVPELRKRAGEFDELRQLPQDVADRLAAAGFYRICAPVGAGGLGLGPRAMCEAVETLATGAGSAAWCAFIGSTSHLNMASATDEFRAREGADPALVLAGVYSSSGTALAASRDGLDGYIVNGHWRWGSGSHNAAWISGALSEVDADGQPITGSRVRGVWLHPDEVDIQDNWHTSGMRGTGSSDFIATDRWVPADRVIAPLHRSAFADDPSFRFPLFGMLAIPIGAIALGMAQASVDEVSTIAKTKTPTGSRRTLATRPLVHFQYAQEQTRLRAARALFYDTIDEVWAKAQAGATDLDDRVAIRTANHFAAHTAAAVIDRMFTIVGGSSVYESSPLQRHRRDVHVAVQHMMTGDSVMELAGRVMLGVDDTGTGL